MFLFLFDPQALQGQMTGHQTAIDTLRKAAESLLTSEGDLLSNSDDIQETVGERDIKEGIGFGFGMFQNAVQSSYTVRKCSVFNMSWSVYLRCR